MTDSKQHSDTKMRPIRDTIPIAEALELCARGEVWPLVSEIRGMEEAETIHALVEQGGITGRAAILEQVLDRSGQDSALVTEDANGEVSDQSLVRWPGRHR